MYACMQRGQNKTTNTWRLQCFEELRSVLNSRSCSNPVSVISYLFGVFLFVCFPFWNSINDCLKTLCWTKSQNPRINSPLTGKICAKIQFWCGNSTAKGLQGSEIETGDWDWTEEDEEEGSGRVEKSIKKSNVNSYESYISKDKL